MSAVTARDTGPALPSLRRTVRARRVGWALALAAAACVASGCSDDESGDSGESGGLSTGVPAHYADGIGEGQERYPEIGTVGMGDARWACPLESSIVVDGGEHDNVQHTAFFQPVEDLYVVECSFYRPLSVDLLYAEAGTDAAFAELESTTAAVEQVGNVQTEEAVTVGERDFVVVRTEYPTNPAAGVDHTAHYLDPQTRSRTTLDVSGSSDDLSPDYDERDAAEDLAAILSAG